MRNLIAMFVTAVCFLFLLKLKWPKNRNIYDTTERASLNLNANTRYEIKVKSYKVFNIRVAGS